MDLVQNVEQLYVDEKRSMREVAAILNTNIWRVRYLIRKYEIPTRTQADTRKIQFLRSKTSFTTREYLTEDERILHRAGIMLYWAEGSKRISHTVDFVNSDQKMVCVFLNMLRVIYQVEEKRLRAYIYCYSDQNTKEIIGFWSKLLKIPYSQFTKPYISKNYDRSNPRKKKHGVIHIRYSDRRLLMKIKQEIDIMSSGLLS